MEDERRIEIDNNALVTVLGVFLGLGIIVVVLPSHPIIGMFGMCAIMLCVGWFIKDKN